MNSEYFDYGDLVRQVSQDTEVCEADIRSVLDTAFARIGAALAERSYVGLHGFGTFALESRSERPSRPYPKDDGSFGMSEPQPMRLAVEFNPAKPLKEAIEAKQGFKVVS